jgi:ABC-type transporter lipoprotein component MlaA
MPSLMLQAVERFLTEWTLIRTRSVIISGRRHSEESNQKLSLIRSIFLKVRDKEKRGNVQKGEREREKEINAAIVGLLIKFQKR